jgi:hypothetical protein
LFTGFAIEKVFDLLVRFVETGQDLDQALHAAWLSRGLGRFRVWNQQSHRLSGFADHDFFADGHPLQQLGKVGFGFVDVCHMIGLD